MVRNRIAIVLLLLLGSGCAPEDEGPMFSEETEDGRAIANVTIQYEGSCEFLGNCSVYSSPGNISWGCGGSDCTSETRYIAAPSSYSGACGDTVTICLRGTDTCTTGIIKDVSCCNRWEAGPAVLRDLGVSFGENVASCSGYGEARVTIYRGGDGPSEMDGDFTGVFCTEPGNTCGGNSPCWADCPAGSTCDYSEGSWGRCVQ